MPDRADRRLIRLIRLIRQTGNWDALRYRLSDSGAKVVVSDAGNIEKLSNLADELPDLKTIFSIGGAAEPVRGFWPDIQRASPHLTPVKKQASGGRRFEEMPRDLGAQIRGANTGYYSFNI